MWYHCRTDGILAAPEQADHLARDGESRRDITIIAGCKAPG
jgi:hypothetical protein